MPDVPQEIADAAAELSRQIMEASDGATYGMVSLEMGGLDVTVVVAFQGSAARCRELMTLAIDADEQGMI